MTSTDIGVSESSGTPDENSLQLSGTGYEYDDFTWQSPAADTPGQLNNEQTIGQPKPDNPASFIAITVTLTEIDLSWILNDDGDDVIIAYNTSNSFGTPVDGDTYSVGSFLGGAEVIYSGGPTTFNHIGLVPNTQYFYKIWSVDGSVNYSSGLVNDASTFSLIISEVADPENPTDEDHAKYVEIYNSGNSTINFGSEIWYLAKRVDGYRAWRIVRLDPSASIAPKDTWVVANNYGDAFYDAYDFYADQEDGFINGNGDDPYFLFYGGDTISGTIVDE